MNERPKYYAQAIHSLIIVLSVAMCSYHMAKEQRPMNERPKLCPGATGSLALSVAFTVVMWQMNESVMNEIPKPVDKSRMFIWKKDPNTTHALSKLTNQRLVQIVVRRFG